MAILKKCANCGTSSWFETWRKVGCPKCGLALSYKADGVPGYGAAEGNDSDKAEQALAAIQRGDTKGARQLLEEVIANVPSDNGHRQDTGLNRNETLL